MAAAAAVGCALVCAATAARADRTIIPLPEIVVDPNQGTTGGVLPVILITTETKGIRSIIAPDIRYNTAYGVYPTFRFFDYPTPRQKYYVIAGKGTKAGEYSEVDYSGRDLFGGRLDILANVQHDREPFERFYGLGNNTAESSETNYTSTEQTASFFFGFNMRGSLQASLRSRILHARVGRGVARGVTQLRDPASGLSRVRGVEGATIVGQRFGFSYDTRDSADIPTMGVFADAAVEVVDKAIGSSASFLKYGVEGRAFVPLRDDKRVILSMRGILDYMHNGTAAPFYERNRIGGRHSLRSFGRGRFTDNHRFVFQGELRSNVYERELFGVRAHLEVTPFLDLARVFHSAGQFPLSGLHPAGGVGFRAVVVPQVVAFVDVGTNGSSPAVFTGIDYPF